MERLIRAIRNLFSGRRREAPPMPDTRSALDAAAESGGMRARKLDVLGGPASEDGLASDSEKLAYEDGLVHTELDLTVLKRCDCGALVAGDNAILGVCAACGRTVCRLEGCSARCERCGALVCRRHSFTVRGHTFCSRHRGHAYWLLFWGVME